LDLYSQAGILFLGNIKSFLLIASARALAAGFVDSHNLMTAGKTKSGSFETETAVNIILILIGLTLFIVLAATRYTWLSVAAKSAISLYSIVVCIQVIVSTTRVRRILVEENQRTGNYAEGIRKLTRLIILVFVLLILGNVAIVVGLSSDATLARTQSIMSETKSPFSGSRILGDISGLIAVAALLMGSWHTKVGQTTNTPPRKSTSTPTPRTVKKEITPVHATCPNLVLRMERELESSAEATSTADENTVDHEPESTEAISVADASAASSDKD